MSRASLSIGSSPAALVTAVALLGAWPHPATAQHISTTLESPALVNASLTSLLVSSQPFARSTPPRVPAIAPLQTERVEAPAARRPVALPALYVSFAVLQGLDVHSTLTSVRAGGIEANPAVRGLVGQPATFVGAKLAATAGTVYLTERLWKKHRVAAVVLLVAVNITYGAIVANNYARRADRP